MRERERVFLNAEIVDEQLYPGTVPVTSYKEEDLPALLSLFMLIPQLLEALALG